MIESRVPFVAAEASYEQVKPMLLSLDASEIRRFSVDGEHAAYTALAAVPRIEPYRGELATLPKTNITDLDLLPKLAGALLWIEAWIAEESRPDIRELIEDCVLHRDRLRVSALPLVQDGLLDSDRFAIVSRSRGYRKLASDLATLKQLYDDRWPDVAGGTMLTEEDIRWAGELHGRLVGTLLVRHGAPQDPLDPTATQLRARAVTLVRGCYGRLRKGLDYLCDSDAEAARIMPSLRRSPRKAKAKAVAVESPAYSTSPASSEPGDSVPDEGAGARDNGAPRRVPESPN